MADEPAAAVEGEAPPAEEEAPAPEPEPEPPKKPQGPVSS